MSNKNHGILHGVCSELISYGYLRGILKQVSGILALFTCLFLAGCGGDSNAAPIESSISEQLIGTWTITEHADIGLERFDNVVIEVVLRADGTLDVLNTSEPSGGWVVSGASVTWEMDNPSYYGPLTWSVLPGNFLRLELPGGGMFLKHMTDYTGGQFSVLKDSSVWIKQM